MICCQVSDGGSCRVTRAGGRCTDEKSGRMGRLPEMCLMASRNPSPPRSRCHSIASWISPIPHLPLHFQPSAQTISEAPRVSLWKGHLKVHHLPPRDTGLSSAATINRRSPARWLTSWVSICGKRTAVDRPGLSVLRFGKFSNVITSSVIACWMRLSA
jgi:hypothetical protein